MDLVVILATCQPVDLRTTLESLSDCNLPPSFGGTIVVENGTPEPTLKSVIEQVSPKLRISYMHCREGNKSSALNVAISSLKENCLIFLTDDDIQFDSEILLHYAEAAAGHSTGIVYGGTVKPSQPSQPSSELAVFVPRSMLGFPRSEADLLEPYFIGSNWAVFSDDVKELGGFDPRFGPGSELRATGQESQMMRIMRSAGHQFQFVESAVIWHKVEPEHYTEKFIADRKFRNGVENGLHAQLANQKLSMIDLLKLQSKAKLIPLLLPLLRFVCSKPIFLSLLIRAQMSRGELKGWHAKLARSDKPSDAETP